MMTADWHRHLFVPFDIPRAGPMNPDRYSYPLIAQEQCRTCGYLRDAVTPPDPRDADPLHVEEDHEAELLAAWRRHMMTPRLVIEPPREAPLAGLVLAGISGFLMGAALMWILR